MLTSKLRVQHKHLLHLDILLLLLLLLLSVLLLLFLLLPLRLKLPPPSPLRKHGQSVQRSSTGEAVEGREPAQHERRGGGIQGWL
jgi:hypothetical protein